MAELKPTPRGGILGAIADALGAVKEFGNTTFPLDQRYERVKVGDALLGQLPEEVNEWSYGNAPFRMAPMGPRIPSIKPGRQQGVFDTAMAGLGAAQTLAKPAGGALDMLAKSMAAKQMRVPAGQLGAIRTRGGNFDEKSIQDYLGDLGHDLAGDGAVESPTTQWAQKQLANYLRKDIGSPADPLLQVEKEIPGLHLPADAMVTPAPQFMRQDYLTKSRELSGGADPTPWGLHSDSLLSTSTVGKKLAAKRELHARHPNDIPPPPEWMEKADPNTPYYALSFGEDQLGFGHVLDYLDAAQSAHAQIAQRAMGVDDNMMRRGMALVDAGLALSPEQVAKTSVADAVRKTAKWNELLAQGQATADLGRGIRSVHKEYPDGLRWVELGSSPRTELPEGYSIVEGSDGPTARAVGLGRWMIKNPEGLVVEQNADKAEALRKFLARFDEDELKAGLNAEGDAMGHCVGGYCDQVQAGTKIYSLRDAQNRPHVTVEARPARPKSGYQWYRSLPDAQQDEIHDRMLRADPAAATSGLTQNKHIAAMPEYQQYLQTLPLEIQQIKGKANQAPVSKYLPYVQDFVKSGKWGQVSDLHNTGLIDLWGTNAPQRYMTIEEILPHVTPEKLVAWRKATGRQRIEELMDDSQLIDYYLRGKRDAPRGWDNTEINEGPDSHFLNHLFGGDYKAGGSVKPENTSKFSAAVTKRCTCGA